MNFLSFNEHLVFHKNWGLYSPYVRASLSNFQALQSRSTGQRGVDPTGTAIPRTCAAWGEKWGKSEENIRAGARMRKTWPSGAPK